MVSGHLLLSAAVDPDCVPGLAIPIPPVPSCRAYAFTRIRGFVGPYGPRGGYDPVPPPVLRERCCQELAAVPLQCRCEALHYMMDDSQLGGLHDYGECTREMQRDFARRLTRPAQCNLPTVDGGMCYALANPRPGIESVSAD